jgi:CheY-like chemotaxis protein
MVEPRLILVVDDDELISMSLADTLREAGYAVLTLNSGEEAVMLLERAPELAGIVTDIKLGPGADGWEVARRARAVQPDVPIVYISGDPGSCAARCLPGTVLLPKPFTPSQIVEAVGDRRPGTGPTVH